METEDSRPAIPASKKAYILETSNACMVNISGMAKFKKLFLSNEWELVSHPSSADFVLVCSCAFNQNQEDYSLETIAALKKKMKPGAELVVAGCLPKINEERLRGVFDGVAFGPQENEKIDEMIRAETRLADISNVTVSREDFRTSFLNSLNKVVANVFLRGPILALEKYFHLKIEPYYKILNTLYDHHIFYIEACSGCLGSCSYCAIRQAKGTLRSVPIGKIIDEFRYGLSQGYKKIGLIGDDLGYYGHDLGTDLVVLLEEILKIEGDYSLLLYYIEPMDFEKMFPRFKKLLGSGKFIDMNIPVQTASNRVTRLMNRNCDIENVIAFASEIRREFPSINVRTHVIVGFPGETEEDFEKGTKLFDAFDEVGVFKYTDRPRTPASRMINKIPEPVKDARVKVMRRRFLRDLYFRKLWRIRFVFNAKKG